MCGDTHTRKLRQGDDVNDGDFNAFYLEGDKPQGDGFKGFSKYYAFRLLGTEHHNGQILLVFLPKKSAHKVIHYF